MGQAIHNLIKSLPKQLCRHELLLLLKLEAEGILWEGSSKDYICTLQIFEKDSQKQYQNLVSFILWAV